MVRRDPVEERASQSRDLYDVATWEPRTALDRLAAKFYNWGLVGARWGTILVALLITVTLLGLVFRDIQTESVLVISLLTLLSALPTFGLAVYIYVADVTTTEPLDLLAATFVLSVLFASFASVINSVFSIIQLIPFGAVVFFYLVVGPGEEMVKLLAVRLYAYRKPEFDAVIDGTVYGAVAGLGFATIENTIYIVRGLSVTGVLTEPAVLQGLAAGTGITATRALAGPGHVIYSAFAGYYLGLAKFNPDSAGPIVAKGIVIAAFIHATYNSLISPLISITRFVFPTVPIIALFFGFVIVYQGFFGYLLYRKISRYRRTYKNVHEESERDEHSMTVERTEFDG